MMKKYILIFLGCLFFVGIYYGVSYIHENQVRDKSVNLENRMNRQNFQSKSDFEGLERADKIFSDFMNNLDEYGITDDEQIVKLIKEELAYDLHRVVSTGNIRAVSAFLNVEKDINKFDTEGGTPLHSAVYSGNIDMVGFLIQRGANVNEGGPYNWTPLMEASYYGYEDIATLLIRNNAKIDSVTKKDDNWNGWFPLAIATFQKNSTVVETLLNNGADPEQKIIAGDWKGWSPQQISTEYGYDEIVNLFNQN